MEYYEDYHLIRERAGERVDHHGKKKKTTLNLEKGKRECEQNHVLSEGKSNKKPTR